MLYDHRGQPVKEAELRRDQAKPSARGARPWTYAAVASGLTPSKLAALFTAADGGDNAELLTLAGDIERRDLHTRAQLSTRKLALAGLPWQVDAASDDGFEVALAEELGALIRRPTFQSLVVDAMDAVMKGFAAIEIGWQRGARWTPTSFTWRDPRHFVFDPEDGTTLRLRTDEKPKEGVEMPAFKFITHAPRLVSGPVATAGLVRPLGVMYSIKTLGVGAWLSFMEIFGIPTRLGKYTRGATEDDIDALEKAVQMIGLDGSGVMPDTTQIELLDAIGKGAATGEHERMTEWADRQISKGVLGQTLTADQGASYAQGKVHNLVRRDILLADALALRATLQRDLVQAYVDLNYGPREVYPQIHCITDEPEDRRAFIEALSVAIDRGLRVEASQVRDRFGLDEPAEGAEVLHPLGQPPVAGGSAPAQVPAKQTATGTQRMAAADDADEPADFIAGESDPADWETTTKPMRAAIDRAAAAGETFDGFLSALARETADGSKLVQSLAMKTLQARGMGDATDEVA
jgi:phage gp29-like protein